MMQHGEHNNAVESQQPLITKTTNPSKLRLPTEDEYYSYIHTEFKPRKWQIVIFAIVVIVLFTKFFGLEIFPSKTPSVILSFKNYQFKNTPVIDRNPALSIYNRSLFLDGKKFRIISGSLHYFRIPADYWYDRLLKAKESNLNTITTYVPWNLHEETPGVYKFDKNLDIGKFIALAQQLGLYVIVRPGPYICAEWEFGGFPGWLLQDPDMRVRTMYPIFVEAVERYFNVLLPKLAEFQWLKGGPIIAFQLENEYGSYDSDMMYKMWMKDLYQKHLKELIFTSDGWGLHLLQAGTLPEIFATVNLQEKVNEAFNQLSNFQPNRPLMVAEFWAGWFDQWGSNQLHHILNLTKYYSNLKDILDYNNETSVNIFMFHGGTNFGFTNGALAIWDDKVQDHRYTPIVTSYDYDALVNEWGDRTYKFIETKNLLKQYQTSNNKEFDSSAIIYQQPTAYGNVSITRFVSLIDVLSLVRPVEIDSPKYMEEICLNASSSPKFCITQNFGYIIYRTTISGSGTLRLDGDVADYLILVIDGQTRATYFRELMKSSFNYTEIIESGSQNQQHDVVILVENMGRINYALQPIRFLNSQRKGFYGRVFWNGGEILHNWKAYALDLKEEFMQNLLSRQKLWSPIEDQRIRVTPAFYNGKINIEKLSDTFINCDQWNKGSILINTINIGRYSSVGPQKTYYVPKSFLRPSENDITLFELHSTPQPTFSDRIVTFTDIHNLGPETLL